MMRFSHFWFVPLLCLAALTRAQSRLPYVNPLIGTAGHGHTFPGATVPFGMVQLSPDTRVAGWDACAGYHYTDSTIIGFSHTHLSGTGVADYGDILLMPSVGTLQLVSGSEDDPQSGYRSSFRHAEEQAGPGYYRVRLAESNIEVELTASARVGLHRYHFPTGDTANVILDLQHGLGPDRVLSAHVEIVGDREITGMRRSQGWARDQVLYFVAQFSRPFELYGTVRRDQPRPGRKKAAGRNVKAYVRYLSATEPVMVKVGISAVSVAGARKNLSSEVPHWDFNRIRHAAAKAWEHELGKIEVEGGTPEQLVTFYTALYHAMVAPNLFCDVDGRYRGMDGRVHAGRGFNMYTVFSLWDTFRAEHPLLTILDRERTLDFVKSLLVKQEESGVLPVWELAANETWCMIGYHAVPVIVEAYMKGIRGDTPDRTFAALKSSAESDRFGLPAYRAHGYIPAEQEAESVSKTLEYAYDDWCLAEMARALGRQEQYEHYAQRAQFYQNMFDPSTGFMRAKEHGRWVTPFDPTAVTNHYTEANAWQYAFFAPHDPAGLMALMGGREKFLSRLEELFTTSSTLSGREQVDISGMIGQYAHGNEPSHHLPYLFAAVGAPWQTQRRVRQIMDSLYTDQPDGLCGNDDCGQLSAWYVLSALGFYSLAPGRPRYVLGSPLFARATMHLENGNRFVISSSNNGPRQVYVQSAQLNGRTLTFAHLDHADLMNGGELSLVMGPEPNPDWGAALEDDEAGVRAPPIVTVPYFEAASTTFADSLTVRLACPTPEAEIHYTVDGRTPTRNAPRYHTPLRLQRTTTLQAMAVKPGHHDSRVVRACFERRPPVGTLTLLMPYSLQYSGGGAQALLDGRRGGTDFRLGAWQGFEGTDLAAVIDLGATRTIREVALSCLHDNNAWIFLPRSVTFAFSRDSVHFGETVTIMNEVPPQEARVLIKNFSAKVGEVRARHVRVRAEGLKQCPDWHKGAGAKAWLFADEITILQR